MEVVEIYTQFWSKLKNRKESKYHVWKYFKISQSCNILKTSS